MKIKFCVFLLLATLLCCKSSMYEINDVLPENLISPTDIMLMVSSAQLHLYIVYEYEDVIYKIAYDNEKK